jgi:para-aminobenzoate synthetase/4-amino-4-deoxychorismate lyase
MALALLARFATDNPGAMVARVDLDSAGNVRLRSRPGPAAPTAPVALILSPFRTDPDDRLLRHKTTLRPLYDREHLRATENSFFDALFLNRLDRVTEGAITNVCVRLGDCWVTPPVDDGLLPGIWRARFIAEHRCEERSLSLDDLLAAEEVVVGNSVRGAIHVGTLQLDCFAGLFD